jgi:hypothetical protein
VGVRLGLITAGALAALALAAPAGARGTCAPRIHTVGSVLVETLCGPARATTHYGGKTYHLAGGSCYRTRTAFQVSVGTFPVTPGTYTYQLLFAVVGSFTLTYVPQATIRLQDGRSHGTFTGKTRAGKAVSGTFHC